MDFSFDQVEFQIAQSVLLLSQEASPCRAMTSHLFWSFSQINTLGQVPTREAVGKTGYAWKQVQD